MEEGLYAKFEIPGLGKLVVSKDLPFDAGIEVLNQNEALPIGLRDLAFARINAEGDAKTYLNANGTYTKESVLFQKGFSPMFLKGSILVEDAYLRKIAVNLQSAEKEFPVREVFFEHISRKTDMEEPNGIYRLGNGDLKYVDEKNNIFVSTDKLAEIGVTKWAYADVAEYYGRMLREKGIEKVPAWFPEKSYLDSTEGPFLRQVWTCCLKGHCGFKGDSGISANNRSLHEKSRLIGIVREKK